MSMLEISHSPIFVHIYRTDISLNASEICIQTSDGPDHDSHSHWSALGSKISEKHEVQRPPVLMLR